MTPVGGIDGDGAGGAAAASDGGPGEPGERGDVPPASRSWRDLLTEVTGELRAAGLDSADQEARWMVERATGQEAAELQLALDEPATVRPATFLRQMLDRRLAGEPLQHVLGRWAFRHLEMYVDGRALIPRPETELLAGAALAECDRLEAGLAVDLGTGSGAVALSLATERPGLEVWGTEVSPGALAVARANLAGLGRAATRVRLVEGSWFEALPGELRGRIDVIVSNPPYVAPEEVADLPAEVRDWEPEVALVAPDGGLAAVAEVLEGAPTWLARPGAVLLEMAPHQAARAAALARGAGFTSVSVWPDLSGRDRVLQARL